MGASAEESLAQLLGVQESLGSRQAKNLLPSRWAHLWVKQGYAGIDLLQNSKDYYDFDSILAQLGKAGEVAIQQSVHDQSVLRKRPKCTKMQFC